MVDFSWSTESSQAERVDLPRATCSQHDPLYTDKVSKFSKADQWKALNGRGLRRIDTVKLASILGDYGHDSVMSKWIGVCIARFGRQKGRRLQPRITWKRTGPRRPNHGWERMNTDSETGANVFYRSPWGMVPLTCSITPPLLGGQIGGRFFQ